MKSKVQSGVWSKCMIDPQYQIKKAWSSLGCKQRLTGDPEDGFDFHGLMPNSFTKVTDVY